MEAKAGLDKEQFWKTAQDRSRFNRYINYMAASTTVKFETLSHEVPECMQCMFVSHKVYRLLEWKG